MKPDTLTNTACAIAFGLFLLVGNAKADTIGAHLVTAHDKPGLCNVNPGAYYRADSGLTVGAYHNSDCRMSAYGGWTWQTTGATRFALTAGLVTGYKAHPVMPLLVPSVARDVGGGWAVRLTAIPRIEKRGANAIHFSLEKSF